MEIDMTTNRRQFSRVSFDAPAQLNVAHGKHMAKVLDLSFKGALVNLTEPARWPVGTPCELTLRLAQLDVSIGMLAEVAHSEDTLLGLQCRSIDLDSITHLRKLIELNLGDPASLDRELQALAAY
jgi:PilZ domain